MSTEVLAKERSSVDTSPVKAVYVWIFRIVITLHAAAAFGQAVLAGRFLSGEFDMLRAHFENSQVVGGLAIGQVVAGLFYWLRGRGLRWPALASIGLLALEPIQIATGIKRVVGVHIPLAVLIIAASVTFAVWAWGPGIRRRRGAK